MTVTVPDYMQRLLDEIAKRKGFRKPRFAVSMGSQTGDNYLGVLYRAVVSDDEGSATPLCLILKGMPANAKRRAEMRVIVFFDNEHNMYHVTLPALARFLADKGMDELSGKDPGFPYSPRCHQATRGGPDGEDVLVLQDMRPLGFTMHDRRQGMDEHHIRAVFRTLAYLHASSFAMEAQRPDEFAKARNVVRETIFDEGNPLHPMFAEVLKRTYGFIKEKFPEGSDGYKKMKVFIDNYAPKMIAISLPDSKGGNAISHGDCWTNNLLFKYSKPGVVERVCLLDFQLSRYSRPVLDLLYLVYCCTEREMRDKHLDGLFREYHDMLGANLKRLGSSVEELYPWKTFQTQLRECAQFGLGMAVMTVPLFLADAEELPDLDAQFESGVDVSDMFEVESKSAPQRDKRITDVLEEMIDRGWM